MDAARIRPLRFEDVEAADRVAFRSLEHLWPVEHRPDEAVRAPRGQARVRHLLQTDPGGCWVAEQDGEVVGTALALIREGIWAFSLFGVDPDRQRTGIGRALFAPALAYGDGCPGAIIVSSSTPAAMRTYLGAGFDLLPCVALSGAVNRTRIPAGLRSRPGDLSRDGELCQALSRQARGATHLPDLPVLLESRELLVCGRDGFAVHDEGSPALLAARDEATAIDLLWSCLAGAGPGGSVHVDFVRAGQDWLLRTGVAAGLALDAGEGPTFVRGTARLSATYLPSGAYL